MVEKYVGMDCHKSSLVIEVMGEEGECLQKTTLATKAEAIKEFFSGLRGTIHVAFEEGTLASWLFELIKPLVAEVVVCDPRANKLLAVGSRNDNHDAHNLADLLRLKRLKHVYHDRKGMKVLKELVHNYDALIADRIRVMNRIKALFRGRGVADTSREVYLERNREKWLKELVEIGQARRADFLYRQLDHLMELCRDARRVMLEEARKHSAYKVIQQVPVLGPIRTAQIMSAVLTPHRFRTKRQFWPYVGFGVVTRSTADYEFINGQLQRRRKVINTRGLNRNYSHRLKYVFKSAAIEGMRREPFKNYYEKLINKGMKPEMARVTLARKIAAVTLAVWKKGGGFDALKLEAVKE